MIQETKGMLFRVPTPYQLTMNVCSHFCQYCFANLNKPDRRFDEKKTFNQILNHRKSKTLTGKFMREKYPVLGSNLVDVFAKNNYKHFLEIYRMLQKESIPIAFQTRGGYGVDEVLKTLPPSYWYISLTSHDDKLIKAIEPNAPPPSQRIELIKKLHSLGHKIEIGINPYMKEFCDIEKVMQMTREYTQFYWLNGFHINNNQKRNLSNKAKEYLAPIMAKGEQEYEDDLLFAFKTMCEFAAIPSGYISPCLVDRSKLFDCYENKMPLNNDFAFHIVNTKKEDSEITFQDYFDFYKGILPHWLDKFDSGYLVSVKRDFKNLKPSYTLEEVLRFHWNNWAIAESSITNATLCIRPDDIDNIKTDENGDIVLKYTQKPFIHS